MLAMAAADHQSPRAHSAPRVKEGRTMGVLVTSIGARAGQRSLVVVARGQSSLLEAVRALAAELGGVEVIEDRRYRPSLLPRGDRECVPYSASLDPADEMVPIKGA